MQLLFHDIFIVLFSTETMNPL